VPFPDKNPVLKEKIKKRISLVVNEGLKIEVDTNRLEHMNLF